MAVEITNQVKVTMLYESGNTYTYTLSDVNSSALSGVVTRANEINNGSGTGGQYTANMKQTFVDDTGSPMLKISGVSSVITEEEVIYNG